jgi:formylglycine-generating enzyme required for sulfatase activity
MNRRKLIKLAVAGISLILLVSAACIAPCFRAHSLFASEKGVIATSASGLQYALADSYNAPGFSGINAWINSAPLTMRQLRGKVVLVDFWTYGCINCVRTLPYLAEWDRKYRDQGLVIVGVHVPEFEFEKNLPDLENAIELHGIHYAVAQDNHYDTWHNFHNHFLPAHYLIDREGRVVFTHEGEGAYTITEHNIRTLLGIGHKRIAAANGVSAGPLPYSGHSGTFRDCATCARMVALPPGSFEMGAGAEAHRVTIRHLFALGKYEVTQAEWRAVMGNNPSHFRGDKLPVERVNWNDVQQFLIKLNKRTGRHYRLPTEAEWEYACRAGGTDAYCGSDDADSVAWYGARADTGGNSGRRTHPVGGKQPNAFGLYDMSGNVWEWVADPWRAGNAGIPGDRAARVIRGGSWLDYPLLARAQFRIWAGAIKRSSDLGFRLALTLPESKQADAKQADAKQTDAKLKRAAM